MAIKKGASIELTHIDWSNKYPKSHTSLAFLDSLSGPSVIHIEGEDSRRTRVLVTLLHGNEPSGLKALHRLLTENIRPKVNIKVFVASVHAAAATPVFSNRMLPGQRDLNRCFGKPKNDEQGQLAFAIKELINAYKPEAIIDLHNTSGNGPGFCVSVKDDKKHLALASIFSNKLIITNISLGSIMEQEFACPIITVEAGGGQNPQSDKFAYAGVKAFFTIENVFVGLQKVDLITHPRRLELALETSLTFAEHAIEDYAVTVRADIEHLNYGITPKGTMLAWVDNKGFEHFKLDQKKDQLTQYFAIQNNRLITIEDLALFMVTTRADIAKSDCLFYFVEQKQNSA